MSKMLLPKTRRHNFYRFALLIWLFQKNEIAAPEIFESIETERVEDEFGRIRCPRCAWQPRSWDRWYCGNCRRPENFLGGCGTLWNTFSTRGLCPGCRHQWRWTSCLACHRWSPHEDWYAEENRT